MQTTYVVLKKGKFGEAGALVSLNPNDAEAGIKGRELREASVGDMTLDTNMSVKDIRNKLGYAPMGAGATV